MASITPKIDERRETRGTEDAFTFVGTEIEKGILSEVTSLFRSTQNERNANLEYFDGNNLVEYIDDSVRRFVTNEDKREDIEDWQARVHDPFTRNKVLAILGKVVDVIPMVEFTPRGDEDLLKAEILNTLFEYSDDVDEAEEFFVYFLLEALVKGTAIGYEGVEMKSRDVREVIKYNDGDELTHKKGKAITRRLVSKIIPLEDFYPSSLGYRRIKDMPYCFWRKVFTEEQFKANFSNYAKSEFVKSFRSSLVTEEARPFYLDYISTDLSDGEIEVLRYYNQETDEFIVVANGVWLNPIEGEIVSPLPFNHKMLPFYEMRYDVFGADFFYGKSLPDRMKKMQDVLNVLHNMLLDQSFLTIFPPILVAGVDDIEDDFLRPGRRITVDTGGLPIDKAYQKLDLGTPTGWHQFILNYTKGIMEESSLDQVQQGVAGVGGRTTATEIRSAAAGVVSLLGLFAKFIKSGLRQRALLRAKNILQFYTDPKNPIIEQVLGDGGRKEMQGAFNVFEIDSSPFTPGDRGVKIVEIFSDKKQLPTQRQLKIRTRIDEKTTGKKINRVNITPKYLRNFQFDMKMRANPNSPGSKELDRALEVQFQQTFLGLHGDIANRKELAAQLAVKFDKDPRKVINEEVFAPPLQPQQETANQLVPNQGGDNSPNTIKGGTGVGGEGILTRDLG